jgi:hypothetical protein
MGLEQYSNYFGMGAILASGAYTLYVYLSASKKERLNEKLKAMTDISEGRFKEVEKDVLNGEASYTALEKRVRVVESRQITEQRVQAMLKERIEPVESAVNKLEDKIERNHRELSTEIQLGAREQDAKVSKLLEMVSYIAGIMEVRRKDDNIN